MAEASSVKDHTVDVAKSGAKFGIQCTNIRLLSSFLRPLNPEDNVKESQFKFQVDVYVKENVAVSQLHVMVDYSKNAGEDSFQGFHLEFDLVCTFVPNEEIAPDYLTEFAKMYTFSILWPYAREYVSDQLRRAGETVDPLPIINAQAMTETLMNAGLVKVVIDQSGE